MKANWYELPHVNITSKLCTMQREMSAEQLQMVLSGLIYMDVGLSTQLLSLVHEVLKKNKKMMKLQVRYVLYML